MILPAEAPVHPVVADVTEDGFTSLAVFSVVDRGAPARAEVVVLADEALLVVVVGGLLPAGVAVVHRRKGAVELVELRFDLGDGHEGRVLVESGGILKYIRCECLYKIYLCNFSAENYSLVD